jgi:hypothetical protein
MCFFREDVTSGLVRGWFYSFEVQGWVICSPVRMRQLEETRECYPLTRTQFVW